MRGSPRPLMNSSRSILNTPSDNTNQQTFVYFAILTEGINLFLTNHIGWKNTYRMGRRYCGMACRRWCNCRKVTLPVVTESIQALTKNNA